MLLFKNSPLLIFPGDNTNNGAGIILDRLRNNLLNKFGQKLKDEQGLIE